MARLADGERAAFDPLFAALYPRALGVARMRLAPSDAADAAQQALVRVFARANEFTPGRAVLPWFYAIIANEVHGLRRKQLRAAGRDADPEAAVSLAADGDPETMLVREELRASVRAAMTQMDDASVEALRVVLGEAPHPDVAAPTFRKRVSRAYARLRVILGGPR